MSERLTEPQEHYWLYIQCSCNKHDRGTN